MFQPSLFFLIGGTNVAFCSSFDAVIAIVIVIDAVTVIVVTVINDAIVIDDHNNEKTQ